MMHMGITKNKYWSQIFFSFISICLLACTEQVEQPQVTPTATVKQAAVAMPDSYSADVAKIFYKKAVMPSMLPLLRNLSWR